MVVLAITGLALTIVFSIGSRASELGFRLGRRVLGQADAEIAAASFEALVGSLVVPVWQDPRPGAKFSPSPIEGDATHLRGAAVLTRATPCGPPGPVAVLSLNIDNAPSGSRLICDMNGTKTALMTLGQGPARFEYSMDGQVWVASIMLQPGPDSLGEESPEAGRRRRLFVRLSTADGQRLWLQSVGSGRFRPLPFDAGQL